MSQLEPEQKRVRATLVGAAFMIGASSTGPGFMVQTSLFTAQYGRSLAAVIVAMIVMDTIVKLNIQNVLDASGLRGQELVNRVLPGSGNVVAILITFGGFTFAIDNVGGAALGLNAVCGLPLQAGYLISCSLVISPFLIKNASNGINWASQVLSVMVLVILLIMASQTHPPMNRTADGLLSPRQPFSLLVPLIALLGSFTGGYVTYTGVHRLPDVGVSGRKNLRGTQKSTLLACGITGLSRILIFLVVFGVCAAGGQATSSAIEAAENPTAQAFLLGAGKLGSRLFGVALFCTSITTIIGSSYTPVSFLKTLYPAVRCSEKQSITGFIVLATILVVAIGKAAALLVIAGVINSFILPLILAVTLQNIRNKSVVGEKYRHSYMLTVTGAVVTAITAYAAFRTLPSLLAMFY